MEAALDDLPAFLVVLGDLIEQVDEYCRAHGLTVGALIDKIVEVRQAESEAEATPPPHGDRGGAPWSRSFSSDTARAAITELYLRRFEPAAIAMLFGFDSAAVAAYLSERGGCPAERDIVQLHREGHTATEIARLLGISRDTVRAVVRRIGDKPNTVEYDLTPETKRIILLRTKGLTYGEIKSTVGVNTNQVRNAIRRGMEKGLLPRAAVGASAGG